MWSLLKTAAGALLRGNYANVSDRVKSGAPNPGSLMGRPKGCPTYFLTSTAPYVEVTCVQIVLTPSAWCRLVEWERAALVVAHAQPELKVATAQALLRRLRADDDLSETAKALSEHPSCWAADGAKISVGELIVRQGAEQALNLPKELEGQICWMPAAI